MKRLATAALIVGVAFGGIFAPATANAATVTLRFEGTVRDVRSSAFLEPVPFSIGDEFYAIVTFDLNASASRVDVLEDGLSTQVSYRAVSSIQVAVGSYRATAGDGVITINDNKVERRNLDAWQVASDPVNHGLTGPNAGGLEISEFLLSLQGPGDMFASGDLVVPKFDRIERDLAFVVFGSDGITESSVTSMTVVAPVPLPAALPLLGGALSLLGFFGWRRKRMAAT